MVTVHKVQILETQVIQQYHHVVEKRTVMFLHALVIWAHTMFAIYFLVFL